MDPQHQSSNNQYQQQQNQSYSPNLSNQFLINHQYQIFNPSIQPPNQHQPQQQLQQQVQSYKSNNSISQDQLQQYHQYLMYQRQLNRNQQQAMRRERFHHFYMNHRNYERIERENNNLSELNSQKIKKQDQVKQKQRLIREKQEEQRKIAQNQQIRRNQLIKKQQKQNSNYSSQVLGNNYYLQQFQKILRAEALQLIQPLNTQSNKYVFKAQHIFNNQGRFIKKYQTRYQFAIEPMIPPPHPNILHPLTIIGTAIIIRKACIGGSLEDKLKQTPILPQAECLSIYFKLVEIMSFLHKLNLMHGCIKPSNILFDQHDIIQLDDFMVQLTLKNFYPKMWCRSANQSIYQSPQSIECSKQLLSHDVYLSGLVLYQMTQGKPVFQNSIGMFGQIMNLKKKKMKFIEGTDTLFIELIPKLLQQEKLVRWNSHQILTFLQSKKRMEEQHLYQQQPYYSMAMRQYIYLQRKKSSIKRKYLFEQMIDKGVSSHLKDILFDDIQSLIVGRQNMMNY